MILNRQGSVFFLREWEMRERERRNFTEGELHGYGRRGVFVVGFNSILDENLIESNQSVDTISTNGFFFVGQPNSIQFD